MGNHIVDRHFKATGVQLSESSDRKNKPIAVGADSYVGSNTASGEPVIPGRTYKVHDLSEGSSEDYSFNLGEGKRPFNVLYVSIPRGAAMEAQLVRQFMYTCRETLDLVRASFNFGLPKSSLRDKCPYWR